MVVDTDKITEIFEYLNNYSGILMKTDGAFIFCRDDFLVARKSAELYFQGSVKYLMFTGGIGKDSGYLADINLPEAKWQGAFANIVHVVPQDKIYLETKATNGGECCRFGINTILDNNLPHDDLTIVAHPTSLRRTWACLETEAKKKGFKANFRRAGTDYRFDPNHPLDQEEAIAELLRLADWPEKGWCEPQPDLPQELVEYARAINF